ncbi:hypothetical protein OS493_029282 [Desmophyllum pertusum]|uniref:Uncharacterized protein n=1 Tax=Desmophyllum pertusum TaxID=174260 RepID=A0A9W9ZLV0_9CNID|nr:hypothetical protein OS493_029282 [Desmophyllum pertusum]
MDCTYTDVDRSYALCSVWLSEDRTLASYYCDEDTKSQGSLIGYGDSWNATCHNPYDQLCSNAKQIADTGFHCTDFSVNEDWSMGENNFTVSYSSIASNHVWTVSYSSCCWISSLAWYADSSWLVSTKLDLTPRSDNGKINSSPVSRSPAIFRLHEGCKQSLRIPVEDPDGDVVKCRWASKIESNIPSDSFPHGVLDEENCVLNYGGRSGNGWHLCSNADLGRLPSRNYRLPKRQTIQ